MKEQGKLSIAMRRGIIALLPKKDKELDYIENWRQITMLTCDYKILAKALALRMKRILQSIINRDQTGFMKDRNIAENIRKTIDVINLAHQHKTQHLIMTIDFQKCFDMLNHEAIWGSLRYFGFGEKFIEWVKLLYNDIQLSVVNNGCFSEYITVSRSTLRGSPIAAYLFLCCGQILHDLITSNANIYGFDIQNLSALISQFADDTTLFLKFSKNVLQAVIDTLDTIYCNTGLIVNYDKTSIYRIGSLANSDAKVYTTREFNWTNDSISLLGVKIPTVPNDTEICEINYQSTINKMQQVLGNWSIRTASLSAKVLIVNALVASLFVYKMQVLPNMTKGMLQHIDNEIYQFIWGGQNPQNF